MNQKSKNQENNVKNATTKIKTLAPLISGLTGGTAGTVLLYPLDLIKVRWQVNEDRTTLFGRQNQKQNLLAHHQQHQHHRKSLIHSLRTIIKYEGILGLYQGLTPSLLGSAISWGGYFYFYEGMKRNLLSYYKNKNINNNNHNTNTTIKLQLGPLDNFACAISSGSIMVGITNPIWLIKTRMQLQSRKCKNTTTTPTQAPKHYYYLNMYDAFKTIIKEEGILALYKGAIPALFLTVHGGVQFVSYEFLKLCFGNYKKDLFIKKTSSDSISARFYDSIGYLSAGAISKIIASSMTYPLQVIKSRLQQRSYTNELTELGKTKLVKRQYYGIIDCIKKMYKYEGFISFFKGCIPNAIRVAPNAAITFVVYETMMDIFSSFY